MKRRTLLKSAGTLAPVLFPAVEGLVAGSQSPSELTLFLCGDVMAGRGIDQILAQTSDPQIHESYMTSALGYVEIAEATNGPIPRKVAPDYIWGDALAEFARVAPVFRIINLETSITTSNDYWPGKGIHYRMHPDNVSAIQAAGVDCSVLANNHVLDWGYAGLSETVAVLDAAGIRHAGAGHNAEEAGLPVIFDLQPKGRLLVIAAGSPSSGVPKTWAATKERGGVNYVDEGSATAVTRLALQIERYRQPGDIVLLSIHWGSNWGYAISDAWRDFAHRLIDEAGVDLIHGHSSHHPRGIEVYNDRLILYGCGDFLNDYEGIGGHQPYRGDLSLMYFPTIDTASAKLKRLEMVPMRIEKFRLNRATASETEWLATTLNRHSQLADARITSTGANTLKIH